MDSTFSERLLIALELRDINQNQLAQKINSTSATISRYVTGKRNPDSRLVKEIAIALGVSADFLLGLSDDPAPSKEQKEEPPAEQPESIRMIARGDGRVVDVTDPEQVAAVKALFDLVERQKKNEK